MRRIRQRLGLTQVELAEALDLNRASIMRWESGEVAIPRLAEFALAHLLAMKRKKRKGAR